MGAAISSGIEKVEGNDDLLMAILIELPPKSIFRFRCVSNRWNNIIKCSFFLKSYTSDKRKKEQQQNRSSDRLMAFIQTTPHTVFSSGDVLARITISPTTHESTTRTIMMKEVLISYGWFFNYSDGLILFGRSNVWSSTTTVLNPLTGKSIVLPPLPTPIFHKYIFGLASEENTNELIPSYRVVAAPINICPLSGDQMVSNTLQIQTYSSKTRKWEKSTLIGTGNFTLNYNMASAVFNGVFHWGARHRDQSGFCLAVYDSNVINGGGGGGGNNNNNNHVKLIQLPDDPGIEYSTLCRRSSTDDVLWIVTECHETHMSFWMLPKGPDCYRRSTTIPKAEWALIHRISHDSIRADMTTKILLFENTKIDEVEFFDRLALNRGDPFVAFIKVGGNKVFLYNVVTKSFELVYCYSPSNLEEGYWTPYKESLTLSSYALCDC